ncbi:MAG: hypothetical protein SGI88_08200 [Candidatus Hydrogenedentes bacterium]|nr:hypothetical protein [Candidatus Hydrogenedentota bacterium]
MGKFTAFMAALLIMFGAAAVSGCEKKADTPSEAISEVADEVKDAAKEAADETVDATKEAADEVKESIGQ